MKQKLKTGDEWDWIGSKLRSLFNWRPGVGKKIKRALNKRFRKQFKDEHSEGIW